MRPSHLFCVLLVATVGLTFGGADRPTGPAQAQHPSSEAVNGLRIELASRVGRQGQPKLDIRFIHTGDEAFGVVEGCPMFLEVELAPGRWQAFQHPRWGTDKLGDVHTIEPGALGSETEPVSAFGTLPPGKYRVRVSLAEDRGMVKHSQSMRLWTGVVRSNSVVVTVPEQEATPTRP